MFVSPNETISFHPRNYPATLQWTISLAQFGGLCKCRHQPQANHQAYSKNLVVPDFRTSKPVVDVGRLALHYPGLVGQVMSPTRPVPQAAGVIVSQAKFLQQSLATMGLQYPEQVRYMLRTGMYPQIQIANRPHVDLNWFEEQTDQQCFWRLAGELDCLLIEWVALTYAKDVEEKFDTPGPVIASYAMQTRNYLAELRSARLRAAAMLDAKKRLELQETLDGWRQGVDKYLSMWKVWQNAFFARDYPANHVPAAWEGSVIPRIVVEG